MKYDRDFTNKLNFAELSNLLKDLFKSIGYEWTLTNEVLKEIFEAFDTDHSGEISRFELKPLAIKIIRLNETEDER